MMVRSPRVWSWLAIGLDILDPGLDGLEAGKLVNDQAISVGRLAEVDPELLAVAQGDALAAVALRRPHDLGQCQGKMARSDTRTPLGRPGMLEAIHTPHLRYIQFRKRL
jgi:hypothetical protein